MYFAAEAALSEKKFDESERLIARFAAEYPQSDLNWKRELLKGVAGRTRRQGEPASSRRAV